MVGHGQREEEGWGVALGQFLEKSDEPAPSTELGRAELDKLTGLLPPNPRDEERRLRDRLPSRGGHCRDRATPVPWLQVPRF